MVLHCSIHYKEEILYEQSDVKKPSLPILAKTSSYTIFTLFPVQKADQAPNCCGCTMIKSDVAVSPCTKTESVFQKLKKTQARKVKIHIY